MEHGVCSSVVERLLVKQDVVGSFPTNHPKEWCRRKELPARSHEEQRGGRRASIPNP